MRGPTQGRRGLQPCTMHCSVSIRPPRDIANFEPQIWGSHMPGAFCLNVIFKAAGSQHFGACGHLSTSQLQLSSSLNVSSAHRALSAGWKQVLFLSCLLPLHSHIHRTVRQRSTCLRIHKLKPRSTVHPHRTPIPPARKTKPFSGGESGRAYQCQLLPIAGCSSGTRPDTQPLDRSLFVRSSAGA